MPQTQSVSHVIIYSHDFGVRKENRGLFTAITRALPDAKSILFDYNPINEASNTLTAKPLGEQALKLRKMINITRADYPEAVIDLVCHGQGCIVAGLVKPRGIRKILLISPPEHISEAVVVEQLRRDTGSNITAIDVTVRTRLARSDGSTTVIHPDYWQSLAGINPVKLYNQLAKFTSLRMLHAREDAVLGQLTFDAVDPGISRVTLGGNHNFDDLDDRNRLVYILQKELKM